MTLVTMHFVNHRNEWMVEPNFERTTPGQLFDPRSSIPKTSEMEVTPFLQAYRDSVSVLLQIIQLVVVIYPGFCTRNVILYFDCSHPSTG